MTPYRVAVYKIPEALFNQQHSKARNIIERTFGVIKSRFRCVLSARDLHYTPSKAALIINVCVALHNLCTLHNEPLPPNEKLVASEVNLNCDVTIEQTTNNKAKKIMDEIKNCLIQR